MTRRGKCLLGIGLTIAILAFVFVTVVIVPVFSIGSDIDEKKLTVQTVAIERVNESALKVTLCLSNANPQVVHVQQDFKGEPALTLQTFGVTSWLTVPKKNAAVDLAPNQALTTTALVTNAPPNFRLSFSVRDYETHQAFIGMRRFLPRFVADKIIEANRHSWNPANPTSGWVQR